MRIDETGIFMTRGDSESITIRRKNGESPVPFQAGDAVCLTVRSFPASKKILLQRAAFFTDEGAAVLALSPDDTKALDFAPYCCDIQLTESGGRVVTLLPPTEFRIGGEVTYESSFTKRRTDG